MLNFGFYFTGTLNKTVLSLSVVHNLNKIVNHSPNKDGLDCINGMKVLSMFLIIMGHRIMFMVGSPLANSDYVESVSLMHCTYQNLFVN